MAVYNLNRDGKKPEESEILEPVHNCVRELLGRDEAGRKMEYSDEDVIAASLLYSSVLGSRLSQKLNESNASMALCTDLALSCGQRIRQLTIDMSSVDTNTHYRK